MTSDHLWWQKGIVYQIYPRSFQDTNGDGVGDLPGITQRLDYLKWLGVDAIWISPCFRSPMKDFGYDVSDYRDIDPLFGTMADFDKLLSEAHSRGLRVILDFVPNHTSDHHAWFLESRSSRDNQKRDWYIWADPKPDGSPPNNWLANFGGIGWTFDKKTDQYYYHAFLTEQPDLNWRNPEVQQAMLDNLRFWLDKGVHGFRVDVMNSMIKDAHLHDNPPNPTWKEGEHPYRRLIPQFSQDQPEVHDIVRMMRELFDAYDERVIIGEVYLPISRVVRYYGTNGDGAHLPFNFQLVTKPWNARQIDEAIQRYVGALPPRAWPNWVLGNHDRPRVATRVGGQAQARVAAILLLTLHGTPTMYQGDEIGTEDVHIPIDRIVDPPGIDIGASAGRDPERTPMQWDASTNAGFSTAEPWLPLADNFTEQNVAVERDDPASILTLYRRLIDLRRAEPALNVGTYAHVAAEGDVIAYTREHESSRFFVALNLGHMPAAVESPATGTVILGTHVDREGAKTEGRVELRGDEAIIVRLS